MRLIQFRIHPGVGMARFGESEDWFFIGPEIPRFLQEQFPNLAHQPFPLAHPARPVGGNTPPQPVPGKYRDASSSRKIMPQAARFRIFAYVWDNGFKDPREPVNVVEVTAADADIEWTVTLANRKTVRMVGGKPKVDLNDPPPRTLKTDPPSRPIDFKKQGKYPNLAWAQLEDTTGRLLVIGNDGKDIDDQTASTPKSKTRLFEDDWLDNAADGPVKAVVLPKTSFLSKFPGAKFFIPGQKDPQPLPGSGEVEAVSAWVVVNMPDYVADMSHFVSLGDLALAQAYRQVADGKAVPVDGRHFLATSQIEDYAFYDYFIHLHPLLGLFTDVARTSGQARNGASEAEDDHERGIVHQGTLKAPGVTATDLHLPIRARTALQLKVATKIDPADPSTHFKIVITPDAKNPFAAGHEVALCTDVADSGQMTVTRGIAGTPKPWPADADFFAATKSTFRTARLAAAADKNAPTLQVKPEDAHRLPMPSVVADDMGDAPFMMALFNPPDIEWVQCTSNIRGLGLLTVKRGQAGTAALDWAKDDDAIAPGSGHKSLNARTSQAVFAPLEPRGFYRSRIFERLRMYRTVYSRKFPLLDPPTPPPSSPAETPFPRQFGRRYDISGPDGIDTVTDGVLVQQSTAVDPGGTLSGLWDRFRAFGGGRGACKGDMLGTTDSHIAELDDMYWIASNRDMPLLKEYAVTQLQYNRFELWANGSVTSGDKVKSEALFERLFKGSSALGAFFAQQHTRDEYLQKLAEKLPKLLPAFLDMASMDRMLGGSFLAGIEVGREAGKPENWSMLHGATKHFADLRFHPITGSTPHQPGMLTKDLAIPWFNDFMSCDETFWPTSRPYIVYQSDGFAYQWLDEARHAPEDPATHNNKATMAAYWKKVGFIRRQGLNASVELAEEEALFDRP